MYSSGYSHVSRHSPPSQKKMQYRSKGKSCGYYMRIVFFFSSLIQSLIIVSLVLFLVYGKTQDSPSTSRILDLEESFSRLSIENVALKDQRNNLTSLLNVTLINKARNDWDLTTLRHMCNMTIGYIQDCEKRLYHCHNEVTFCKVRGAPCPQILPIPGNCNCGLLAEQMKARLELVESNFTQTVQRMRMEIDQTAKERDYINLEAIRLRRDKSTLEKELQFYRQKSKDEFSLSLSSVTNVSRAFLQKIDSLFPAHIKFQLTCPKQREHLEQIHSNCTSLSREVEDKLQHYLNIVGDQVSAIQSESTRLKAENWRLSEDYRWCSQNRTGLIAQHRQNFDKLQRKHDQDKEKLLMEKMRLIGDVEVLENSVKFKSKEVDHLTEQLKLLNMSCMAKTGFGGYSGGLASRSGTQSQSGWGLYGGGGSSSASSSSASSSSSSVSQLGRTGSSGLGSSFSSSGSSYNKPASTGTGSSSSSSSSLGSGSSLSSSGSGFNKPASTGGGFSNYGSAGSSTSLSSSGTGSNKPAVSGRNSSPFGSSSGSTGSSTSLSSGGLGSNKQPSSGGKITSPFAFGSSSGSAASSGSTGTSRSAGSAGSTGSAGSSGSTGSTSKSGSNNSGFSWLGFGSSNSGQSKTGSTAGKGTSSGTGFGGSSGRTSGLVSGPDSVAQHLQDLRRLINPPGPEDKQGVSSVLG